MFSLAWTGKRPWLTAPFLAAQNGHVDVLHMLIYGCTVEEADALPHHPKRLLVRRSLEKCLLVACRKGHIKIVSLLIGTRRNFFWIRNLNVVVNLKRRLASGLENHWQCSAEINRLAVLAVLSCCCSWADAGVNPDCIRDDNLQTPLFTACRAEQTHIVRLLCEQPSVNMSRIDKDGDSPLMAAVRAKSISVVSCLILGGCNVNFVCAAVRS